MINSIEIIMRNIFRRMFNTTNFIACAVFFSIMVLALALHCINTTLPDPQLGMKALSCYIVFALALDALALIIKVIDTAKRWKTEGFTFSLKLNPEEEDEE